MYKCQKCKRQQGPGIKANKRILQIRPIEYEVKTGPHKGELRQGSEIVKEITVCAWCVV